MSKCSDTLVGPSRALNFGDTPGYTERSDDERSNCPEYGLPQFYGSDGSPILAMWRAMIAAYAKLYGGSLILLRELEMSLTQTARDRPTNEQIAALLDTIGEYVGAMNFHKTKQHIAKRSKEIRNGWIAFGNLPNDIKNIRERLTDDAKDWMLFSVNDNNVHYHSKPQLFGAMVAEKLPDANRDITEAGTCFSLGCATACVLHLMRALEAALKTLAAAVPGFTYDPTATMNVIAIELTAYANKLPKKPDPDYNQNASGNSKKTSANNWSDSRPNTRARTMSIPNDEPVFVDGQEYRVTMQRISEQRTKVSKKPRITQTKFGYDCAIREVINGEPAAYLVGRIDRKGQAREFEAWKWLMRWSPAEEKRMHRVIAHVASRARVRGWAC